LFATPSPDPYFAMGVVGVIDSAADAGTQDCSHHADPMEEGGNFDTGKLKSQAA